MSSVLRAWLQFGGVPASWPAGAPRVLKSTPDEAVVSLETMVLLTMFTASASCSETPRAVPAGHVVGDDVVGDGDVYQLRRTCVGKLATSVPLTPGSAGRRRCRFPRALPMIRLALITRPGPVPSLSPGAQSASVTVLPHSWPPRVEVRHPGRAHDDEAAAVGRDGRVGALVEQDRVVLDVAVPAEPDVSEAAAVAGAHVAADPVVVELIVVGAGAEADAARARRRGREQFVADGGVLRDRVVVHVHVQVEAVRQLRVGR